MDFRWSTTNRKKSGHKTGRERERSVERRKRERGTDPGCDEGEGEEGAHGLGPKPATGD